jgi:NADP-dependent 3-hydroxy acid dehydrogenase YdfG
MQNIKDQTALVTGGGSGIGSGIAQALADAGAQVVICGRRKEAIEETAHLITAAGGKALAVQADVSDADQVDSLVRQTNKAFGDIRILVNNAGIDGGGRIAQHSIADWDQVMAVNLRGPFLLCRAVLPQMQRQKDGHIINISSESATEHYTGDGAYGVAKHALNALSEYIQRENQDYNIRVDTICPGMVVTEMTQDSPGLDHKKCLYPEDIADLVIWLISRRQNIKIGTPILIQTMLNPWE